MAKVNMVIWAKRIRTAVQHHSGEQEVGKAQPEPQPWPPCEEWTGCPGGLRLHLWKGTEAQPALW